MKAIKISATNFLVKNVIDLEANQFVIMNVDSETRSRSFFGDKEGEEKWQEASEKFPVVELFSNEELRSIYEAIEVEEDRFMTEMANDHTPYYFEGERV